MGFLPSEDLLRSLVGETLAGRPAVFHRHQQQIHYSPRGLTFQQSVDRHFVATQPETLDVVSRKISRMRRRNL